MAKRKHGNKNSNKENFRQIEWNEGDIYATDVNTGEKMYFVALKGNPLIVRTMLPEDLDAVFKEYNKTGALKSKAIRKLRKSVANKSAMIVEAVTEDWYLSDTPTEIASKQRVIVGIGEVNGTAVEATLKNEYADPIYVRYLQEIVTYIGFIKSKGKKSLCGNNGILNELISRFSSE